MEMKMKDIIDPDYSHQIADVYYKHRADKIAGKIPDHVIDFIAGADWVILHPYWVLSTKKQPEKNGKYLVAYWNDSMKKYCQETAIFNDGVWYVYGNRQFIKAWTYLPKLPDFDKLENESKS